MAEDYESYDAFMAACRWNRESLDPSRVLGKIYPINRLRELAKYLSISSEEINQILEAKDEDRMGVTRRHAYAQAIAQLRDTKQIGEALSYFDHDLQFPVLTYYRLSEEKAHKSSSGFLDGLKEHYTFKGSKFEKIFNGLTDPAGAACKLESVRVHGEDTASLLFSCTRVLLSPEGQIGNYNQFFLARIPVLAYFFLLLWLP